MGVIRAGTSGFSYPSWKPGFYPADVPARRFLEHYAARLTVVEANYTFRRAPSAATLQGWVERTPQGFLFAPKAHQRITHARRLKDAAEPVSFFLASLEPLRAAGRLGPVLFQLPPSLAVDLPRLREFLALLPAGERFSVEFRDRSWFTDEMFEVLQEHQVALCVAESEVLRTPDVVTAGFAYYRLRRPDYSSEEIEGFARRARELAQGGRDVFLIFKHEESPAGALHAERVLDLVR
jgi:uncharacterized protein YecE (DUF72 family)